MPILYSGGVGTVQHEYNRSVVLYWATPHAGLGGSDVRLTTQQWPALRNVPLCSCTLHTNGIVHGFFFIYFAVRLKLKGSTESRKSFFFFFFLCSQGKRIQICFPEASRIVVEMPIPAARMSFVVLGERNLTRRGSNLNWTRIHVACCQHRPRRTQ